MNINTLLGVGAIGGAIYLATSKKAQSRVKKSTGLSDNKIPKSELKELIPHVAGRLRNLGINSNNFNKKKAIVMVDYDINKFQSNPTRTEAYKQVIETYPKELKSMLDKYNDGLSGVYDQGILKCVFLAGGSGSGKSYVTKEMFGVDKYTFVSSGLKLVNSDIAFEKGMKKANIDPRKLAEIEKNDPELWAKIGAGNNSIRGKAKTITDKQQRAYEMGRLGLVVDGTGDDYDKMVIKKAQAESLGYDCYMIFVNTTLDVAIERNRKRERRLPDKLVKEKWFSAQTNLAKYHKLFGSNFVEVKNQTYEQDKNKIRKAIERFIKAPIKNPIGKKWIATELNKKNRG